MFQPFQVLVDLQPVNLLQPCPTIISLIITHHQGFPIPIQLGAGKPVAAWLYDLSQRATSISYNGTLLSKNDIKEIK